MPKTHTQETRFGPQPIRVVLYTHGISASRFAERIGINPHHVSKVNRGYTAPAQVYIDRASEALSLPPSELFTQDAIDASYFRDAEGRRGA